MRRLIASIHDVGPRFEAQVDALYDRVAPRLGDVRPAMLVVPDYWGAAPIRPASPFAARLRRWAEAGVEMFVHGWLHRDDCRHAGAAALKARHMTAGEGEFLGLDRNEAARRMRDGRALIEDITGRAAAGFIAPAWLYGRGARDALADSGFAIAEDHWRVWSPEGDRTLARGPVVTWATRSPARLRSSLAAAWALRRAARPMPTVRVAVHPGDAGVTQVLRSLERTLEALRQTHVPARYADLL